MESTYIVIKGQKFNSIETYFYDYYSILNYVVILHRNIIMMNDDPHHTS